VVRDAFLEKGHDAYSCDLLPGNHMSHIQGDVLKYLSGGWDLMIAHPPCTRLCSSGARWWKDYPGEQDAAIEFVLKLWAAPIKKKAIENPIGVLSTKWRKPDQIIHPWMFGHGETKATCLWLDGVPTLKSTHVVSGRENRIHKMSESKDRWKKRSITYSGIAKAMADQWGGA